MENKRFSKLIKSAIENSQYKTVEICKKLGISRNLLSLYTRGATQTQDPELIKKICDVLNINYGMMLNAILQDYQIKYLIKITGDEKATLEKYGITTSMGSVSQEFLKSSVQVKAALTKIEENVREYISLCKDNLSIANEMKGS